MEKFCRECMRVSLRTEGHIHRVAHINAVRSFSTTIQRRADEPSKLQDAGRPATSQGPRNPSRSNSSGNIAINAPPPGQLLIRRTSVPQGNQSPRSTGPPRSNGPTRTSGPPPGLLIRRTGGPPQSGQFLRRTGPPRQGGRPGPPGRAQGPPGKTRKRRTAASARARDGEDEIVSEEVIEDYLTKYIDRPANPTEPIDYDPKPQKLQELQKDWPNTPLSATGLSATIVQKIESLAKRIPHGYQTPEQLAEHFHKGYLTKFESEEEKRQVLKIAAELAQQRASMMSERKGTEVAVEDMSFTDLNTRDEKSKLVSEIVKGEVGELQRQRMPFLESVVRNLRNNETYHKPEMDRFMATVQRLMPAQTQRRPQQQGQKAA